MNQFCENHPSRPVAFKGERFCSSCREKVRAALKAQWREEDAVPKLYNAEQDARGEAHEQID